MWRSVGSTLGRRLAPVWYRPHETELGPLGGAQAPVRGRRYPGGMAQARTVQVTFDCAEPVRVARFWAATLGYVVPPEDMSDAGTSDLGATTASCHDPAGVGPRLFFQRVPEGKTLKNRVHLDVRVGPGLVGDERVTALEVECARLVALGATRVRLLPADDEDESCLVMQDVEGNEFCLD